MSTPADPVPSVSLEIEITTSPSLPAVDAAGAVAVPVATEGPVPPELNFQRAALEGAGFRAVRGSTFVVPSADGRALVALGIGNPAGIDAATVRDVAGDFA